MSKKTWIIAGGGILAIAVAYALQRKNVALKSLTSSPQYKVTGPLVSIVVPTLQEEHYLAPLLMSASNQTYEPIEVVIADGPGGEESKRLTHELVDAWSSLLNVKMVDVPEKNVSMGRNAGAAAASGEILLILDADCILEPQYIEKLADDLDRGAVLSHGIEFWYDADLLNAFKSLFSWVKPRLHTTGRGVLIRKKDFDEVNGYREDCNPFIDNCHEDVDFGARVEQTFGHGSVWLNKSAVVAESHRRPISFGVVWPERGWRRGEIVERSGALHQ